MRNLGVSKHEDTSAVKVIDAANAQARFADFLERVVREGRPIAISQNGEPALAMVPLAMLPPDVLAAAAIECAEAGISKSRLEAIERLAKLGRWEWDEIQDRCTYCSEGLAHLAGTTPSDYLKRTDSHAADLLWVHPEDQAHYEAKVLEAKTNGAAFNIEYRFCRADGRVIQVHEESIPIFDADGKMVASHGYVQDITDRKTIEEGLQRNETLLTQAMRLAKLGAWVWDDRRDVVLHCSEELARLYGQTIEEYTKSRGHKEGVIADIHPEDRERYRAAVLKGERERSLYEVEFRERVADGSYRHFFEVGEAMPDRPGLPPRSSGILQDITERKAVEEELLRYRDELEALVREQTAQLRASEQRLKEAERIASLGSWERRADGQGYWSDGIFRILGIEREGGEQSISSFYRMVHPDDIDAVLATAKEGWWSGEPYTQVYRILRSDGEVRHLRESAEFLTDDKGNIEIARGTCQDITESMEFEARLRRIQRVEAIGQLTGGIAHDFNNLLAVIQGNVELLEDQLGADAPLVAPILRASERGAELTQRLLAFSRRQQLRPRPTDIAKLMVDLRELLRRTLGETIELETASHAEHAVAVADAGQVENAILNLALNARDAMPKGGKLTIECHNAHLDEAYVAVNPEAPLGDYVVLAVSDEGQGMTEEVSLKAFEPFFTTKDVGQGSGLGLSMVYGFAKQSGGHLSIYSEIGQGTTVKLYLPLVSGQAEEAPPKPHYLERGAGETILVIEDDGDLRDLAVRLLKDLGYRVLPAGDIATARSFLESKRPVDLILSDVVLPGDTNGPDFAEEVRRDYPGLRTIFMSGYPIVAARRHGFLGPDKVLLRKPFERRKLAEALRAALD